MTDRLAAEQRNGFHIRTGERVDLSALQNNRVTEVPKPQSSSWNLTDNQPPAGTVYSSDQLSEALRAVLSQRTERSHMSDRAKKRVRAIGWTAAVVGMLTATGGIIYTVNPGDIVHTAPAALGLGNAQAVENGITLHSQLTSRPESFYADQCILPTSIFGIATVNLAYPEVPLLTNKDHSAPYEGAPYLLDSNETKTQQNKLANFNTLSGYPELTLNSMPLGITICDLGGGIKRQGTTNVYNIDISNLRVRFESPGSASMLRATINPIQQINGIQQEKGLKDDKGFLTSLTLNPKKGEWVSYPVFSKAYQGGIDTTNKPLDPALYSSVNAFQTQMQSEGTVNTLIALAEESFVHQLSDPAKTLDNIAYDDNSKSTTDYLTKLILERLGADTVKSGITGNAFKYDMDFAVDKTTKQPITVNAAITSIKLDRQERIKNVVFQSGSPNIPAPSPTPTAPTKTLISTNLP
jgi:hypothetical protein